MAASVSGQEQKSADIVRGLDYSLSERLLKTQYAER